MCRSLKKLIVLTFIFSLLFLPKVLVGQSAPYAIIGGFETVGGNTPAYGAIVSLEGVDKYVATKLTGGDNFTDTNGSIFSVAINSFGTGIIGGRDNNNTTPYAAFVSPEGVATILTGQVTQGNGRIFSVAINSSGVGIIGGDENRTGAIGTGSPYAAIVSREGVARRLAGQLTQGNGFIPSVAINSFGTAIIGGVDNGNTTPYAALVSPEAVATILTGQVTQGTGIINSVAINSSGVGIIGGIENTNRAYQALVSPTGVATRLTGQVPNPAANGRIVSVAINSSGCGIIGGGGIMVIPPSMQRSFLLKELQEDLQVEPIFHKEMDRSIALRSTHLALVSLGGLRIWQIPTPCSSLQQALQQDLQVEPIFHKEMEISLALRSTLLVLLSLGAMRIEQVGSEQVVPTPL